MGFFFGDSTASSETCWVSFANLLLFQKLAAFLPNQPLFREVAGIFRKSAALGGNSECFFCKPAAFLETRCCSENRLFQKLAVFDSKLPVFFFGGEPAG